MVVSSEKTAFGQAMLYTLSKVGKPERCSRMNCESPTLTTSTYIHADGSPLLSVNATRNIGSKQPSRLACFFFASTVNKLVACFASSSKRQAAILQSNLAAREGRTCSSVNCLLHKLYGKCNGSLRVCANSGYQALLSDFLSTWVRG